MNWAARLLIGLTLIIVGAAGAVWALARYEQAARFFGVTGQPVQMASAGPQQQPILPDAAPGLGAPPAPGNAAPLAQLETRLARVERATEMASGSAGRADALVIAFAARRAIDRGSPLGFLENLLIDRFGARNGKAVATVISASRAPVRLDQLVEEYESLAPRLRASGSGDSWWSGVQRELGSLIEIRRAEKPSTKPDTRYRRASARLSQGDVDGALAETMRLPGAANASDWTGKARRYIAAHRALDELESAALIAAPTPR